MLLALLISSVVASPVALGQDLEPYEAEAQAVMQTLRGVMMRETKTSMPEGPIKAVGTCRHRAPEIGAKIETETGRTIRRTGLMTCSHE